MLRLTHMADTFFFKDMKPHQRTYVRKNIRLALGVVLGAAICLFVSFLGEAPPIR